MQVGKIVNARHMVCHVGPYGEYDPGADTNEEVANILAGVVERVKSIWGQEGEEEDYAAFPWVHEAEPTLVAVETSGQQELWGTVEEVLEVCNHVPGTVPVLNMAHIHARGHGRLKTSEVMQNCLIKPEIPSEARPSTLTLPESNTEWVTLNTILR